MSTLLARVLYLMSKTAVVYYGRSICLGTFTRSTMKNGFTISFIVDNYNSSENELITIC